MSSSISSSRRRPGSRFSYGVAAPGISSSRCRNASSTLHATAQASSSPSISASAAMTASQAASARSASVEPRASHAPGSVNMSSNSSWAMAASSSASSGSSRTEPFEADSVPPSLPLSKLSESEPDSSSQSESGPSSAESAAPSSSQYSTGHVSHLTESPSTVLRQANPSSPFTCLANPHSASFPATAAMARSSSSSCSGSFAARATASARVASRSGDWDGAGRFRGRVGVGSVRGEEGGAASDGAAQASAWTATGTGQAPCGPRNSAIAGREKGSKDKGLDQWRFVRDFVEQELQDTR
ncbi:hypothetical protein DFJ74DRAFT_681057 [Hyaloraphidium curvatum]|nr:hypothetical protein DFJ74DRAFT_681057 [Hyaloraphidium curvatum]